MTSLMQAVHSAVKTASPNYIVMFATGPGYYLGSYDFAALHPQTDFFFYFGYDWKNPQNGPMTNPGTTQYTTVDDQLPEASVKGGIQYVLNKGVSAAKIICGLPFYGALNTSWSTVRDTWAANQAGYLAAIDPNSMEVLINEEWFTSPDAMKKKLDALLQPNSLHPGVVRTGIWGSSRGLLRLLPFLARPFMISAERGAQPLIKLTSDPACAGLSGRYFLKEKDTRSSPLSYDTKVAARLWETSAALITGDVEAMAGEATNLSALR